MTGLTAYVVYADDNAAHAVLLLEDEQLEDLQAFVGGWVEVVYSSDGRLTFWCNEEGKINGLPVNSLATALWWGVCPEAVNVDVLCGNVVITGGADDEGETLPVPEDMVEYITSIHVPEES